MGRHAPVVAIMAGLVCVLSGRAVSAEAPGPRGPTGPDVPLAAAEERRLVPRITVEDRTAAAVQEACRTAQRQRAGTVYLPAGEYVFESTVRVPGGLTVLGAGSQTRIRVKDRNTRLFAVEGDRVRFTRLRLEGADPTPRQDNDSYGITAMRARDVRIDHCELSGFSYATNFGDEATAQIDHCSIHHNLRDGLGYGVAVYSGAYVLVIDNDFSQNRHSLASNGALDWSSGRRLGRYVHKPGVRRTHWEFIHNRVRGDDQTTYQLCAVDTHPGMDGTFVVEANVFEDLRHAVGIRDGSGIIRGNLLRNLRGHKGRAACGISIAWGTHNNIPVEGTMPRDIQVSDNVFADITETRFSKYEVGKAENVTIDGALVESTRVAGPRPAPSMPRLRPMDEEGILRWSAH